MRCDSSAEGIIAVSNHCAAGDPSRTTLEYSTSQGWLQLSAKRVTRHCTRAALDSRSNTQSKSHASNSQAEPRPHTRCITSATLACIRHAFTSALSAANTSHVTRHTSHVTRHTSHVTRHPHQRCKARAAHLHCNSAHAKQPHFAQTPAATPS